MEASIVHFGKIYGPFHELSQGTRLDSDINWIIARSLYLMQTSNLITDYIITGFIFILAIIAPGLMIDFPKYTPALLREMDEMSSVVIISFITLITYVVGVINDQLSDAVLKQRYVVKMFGFGIIQEKRRNVRYKTNKDYYEVLQLVIAKSRNSFEYLSFRRSIIRILRASIVGGMIFIIGHLTWSCIFYFYFDVDMQISLVNFGILLLGIPLVLYFLKGQYISLYTGYYDSVVNFYKACESFKTEESHN